MSLASASPRGASHNPEIVRISTSPLPVSPAARRHRQPVQPPPSFVHSSPPARSSSPRHHTHVSAPGPPSGHASARSRNQPSTPSFRRQLSSHSYMASQQQQQQQQQLAADEDTAPAARAANDTSYAVTDRGFIREFLRQDFSSPSGYPSFTNPPLDEDGDDAQVTQASECMGPANNRLDSPSLQLHGGGASASTTQNTDSTIETQYSSILPDDAIDDNDRLASQYTPVSLSETMPATARRVSPSAFEANYPPPKRQRASRTQRPAQPREEAKLEEDVFGDLVEVPAADADDLADENLEMIDLTEATEVPEELRKPVVDNRIKISAFQCAICMDDVTGLTVTYCGHLFCAQCLHSSLEVESTKGKCPMCRAKIDMKPRESYTTKTKGFWPLELKIMTAAKRGKRKANAISK